MFDIHLIGTSRTAMSGGLRPRTSALVDRLATVRVCGMAETHTCRRCGLPVIAYAADFETFEEMHYVCFHYAFEHEGDPDIECTAGGCPAAGAKLPSLLFRTEGIDIAQAGNTVVPAILVLRELGFQVEQNAGTFVAKNRWARFVAEDPVALLGLVRMVELRRPWRASDLEIDDVLAEFDL